MHAYKLINQTIKDYTFVKSVGKGAWATVFQAIDRKTGQQVAIKAVERSLVEKTPKIAELINTEIRVLKNCRNENVISYVDSITTHDYIFLVIEFCNGGDLEQYLLKRKRLSEDEATTFLKQMINGFKGLHEVNAMHRDFKTANVLIHNGICKIADLGFAKQLIYKQQQAETILGTCLTMAPQILEGKSYGMEADIYSIGVVYYFMIYGKYPFTGNSDKELLLNIRNKTPRFEGVEITAKARDFMEKCLAYDVKKRFSWETLYEHPLIAVEDLSNQYMAASRFDAAKNKEFYKKGMQINGNEIFEKREVIKEEDEELFGKQVHFKKEEIEEVKKLQMEGEKKAKIELAVSNFQQIYLARRNAILFVFKFIHPYIEKLMMVKAYHALAMFLMGKKAYLDMKELLSLIQKKKNLTINDLYFEEFLKSKSYVDLTEMIASTKQMVGMQVGIFKDGIQSCSGEVQAEFDIESSSNPNFKAFLRDIIGQYWFLLADGLDILEKNEDIKKSLLHVMSALDYYQNNQVINAKDFALNSESINYKKEEQRIRARIASIYQ